MSPYLAGGLLVAFIVWSGTMVSAGYNYKSHEAAEADAKQDLAQATVTIKAQDHVITTVQKQQQTTQGIEHAYFSGITDIDNLYSVRPAQSTASDYLPAVPSTTCRSNAASIKYKLSPKQCDKVAERLTQLQQWVTEQKKIQ